MNETKAQQWNQVKEQCQRITDVLGYPIDAGILDLVVALNVLQIPTTGSCEGHLDHGTMAPWVDIEAPGAQEEQRQAGNARREAREADTRQESDEAIYQLMERVKEHEHRASCLNLTVRARLMDYLDTFYHSRQVPYDHRLSIQGIVVGGLTSMTRLESQGAGLQDIRTPGERGHYLQIYQAEMRAFAHFLKATFEETERA